MSQARRTRHQCNRQQSRASRKMRRSPRLAHEAPVMQARRTTTRALPRIFRLIWISLTPRKKTYLNPSNQKRKILAKLSNPQKSRNRKFQTPKTEVLRSGPVTWNPKYSPSPPSPALAPTAWLQDLWASETEKPSLMPSQYQELLSRRKPGDFLCFAAQDSFSYQLRFFSSETINKIWNFDLIEIL